MRSVALIAALLVGCRPPDPLPVEPGLPCVVVTPRELDFGEVPNQEQKSRNLRITSTVDTVLNVQLTASGPSSFTIEEPSRFQLAPRSTANRLVRFLHDDSKLHLGAVEIDADPNCHVTVPLRGLGQGTVEVEPATLDFGFVMPGEQKTLELRFVNHRRTAVTLFNVHFDPPTQPAFGPMLPSELQVPALSTLPIAITAAPPADVSFTATLSAQFDVGTVQSALVVIGGAPVAELSERAISVPTAGFALPSFPPTFVDRQLWLRNVTMQGRALEARLRIVPPEFKVESLDGGAVDELTARISSRLLSGLNPGEKAPIELHFVPSSFGSRSYDVTFFTNDPVQPEQVVRFETIVDALPECTLTVTPTRDLMLTRNLDGTSSGTITFTNTGTTSCVVDDLRLEEPSAVALVLRDAPVQLTLAPGASHMVTMSRPSTLDALAGTFGFHVLNANSVRQRITVLEPP